MTKHQCDTCASDVHTFWPLSDPLGAFEHGSGLHPGEVRSRVGFAVALAPALLATQDRREEPHLLLRRPELDERGREQVLPHVVHACRRLRARVFLGPDDLLRERRAPAAVLDRPAETDEARTSELALPADARVEAEVFVAWTTTSAQLRVLPHHMVRQPFRRVAAELVVVDDVNVRHRAAAAERHA